MAIEDGRHRDHPLESLRGWLWAARMCGAGAALLGLLTLVGWLLEATGLTALQPGRIPMAPSTAVLLLVVGGLMGAAPADPSSETLRRTRRILAIAAAGIAATLLALSIAGISLPLEQLGLVSTQRYVAGAPVGHMSPLTAGGLLLAAVLVLLTGRGADAVGIRAAVLGSLALEIFAAGLTTAYLADAPALYWTGVIPPALNTSLALLLLGTGLLALTIRRLSLSRAAPARLHPDARLVFAGLAAVTTVIALAVLLFRGYQRQYRAEVEARLLAIADLRVSEIEFWRAERLRDASVLFGTPGFRRLAERALDGEEVAVREIETSLDTYRKSFRLMSVSVHDTGGARRFSATAEPAGEESEYEATRHQDLATSVLQTRRVTVAGFHRNTPSGPVHLTIATPVFGEVGDPVAVVLSQVDPDAYLYPLLQRWPIPSRTSRTLLVRREGEDVVVLNRAEPGGQPPLTLRLPVDRADLPSAMAIRGSRGIVSGRDHRGEPVIAAIRPVADSDWYLVASMDAREIYRPLAGRLLWTIVFVVVLLVGVAGAAVSAWQRREKIHFREGAATQRRYAALLHGIADGVIATDADGRVEVINEVAAELTGWPESEAIGVPIEQVYRVVDEETGSQLEHPMLAVIDGGTASKRSASSRLVARDGTERPIAHAAATIRDEEGDIGGGILVFRDRTEEHRARKALTVRESKYRALFTSIRDAILVTNTDRQIIDCNPAFTELFGYTLDEIAGQPTSVVYATEEEFRRMGEKLRAAGPGAGLYAVVHFRKKDGTIFPGEARGYFLRDEEGGVTGFVGIIRDVTQQVAAERALEESERRFRTLFTEAPVGIFRTRSDGRTLRVNRALAEMLGFESPGAAVEHYTDLARQLYVDPDRRAEFIAQLREHGSVEDFVYQARTRSGRLIWLEMDARIADDHDDGTFTIEGFVSDVTEQFEAERALQRHRTMLERTERIAHIGSWELDLDTGATRWSDQLYRIFGMDPVEVAPETPGIDSLFPKGHAERLRAALARAASEGEPFDIEVEATRTDGEKRACRVRGSAQHDVDGSVVRLYGSFEDITERRRREEQEAALRAQLAQAQKLESVGRLAGGVAHDFNNMLSVILGHTEIIQETLDESDPVIEGIHEIHDAALRSSTLTRQLLSYARQQVATPTPLDLNEAVPTALKMLRRLVGEQVEVEWHPSPDPCPVFMDPGQLDQVLTNLLVNARDAIEGHGVISVRTASRHLDAAAARRNPDADAGDYHIVSVRDDGRGMDDQTISRLFEPFFTTKPREQGTGLGLATVYGIVRQNEGFITVESEPGEGSTFAVHLPHFSGDIPTEKKDQDRVATGGGGETVLVVEDQEPVLRLAQRILERAGYTVLTATSPSAALEIAGGEQGIDLLLTDVVMPEMDGLQLARRIREVNPDCAALFMSGYPADVIAEHGILDGGVVLVEKPFTVAELTAKVRGALEP